MFIKTVVILITGLVCCLRVAAADTATSESFVLSPPDVPGPVVVRVSFELHDINEINDEMETFEFTGIMKLTWHDPRQAFDPDAEGLKEKVFTGNYQFNEISPGWYPELVLVNESGMFQKSGVILRIQPDGTSTLIETINAVAETEFNMVRYPFDKQRLQAVFQVLGYDKDEVMLQIENASSDFHSYANQVPQWDIKDMSVSITDRQSLSAGQLKVSSAFYLATEVNRDSFYALRLIVLPLILIVLLSFSIFWMERSSLGDRVSVSFIGILTAVAYQGMTGDLIPHISYVTLIHAFINVSFITMCATVPINLIVGAVDRQGKVDLGDRIDRHCRWIFPLIYFGLLLTSVVVTF